MVVDVDNSDVEAYLRHFDVQQVASSKCFWLIPQIYILVTPEILPSIAMLFIQNILPSHNYTLWNNFTYLRLQ